MLNRRRFLAATAGSLLAAAAYTRLLEPTWLHVSHWQVPFFPSPAPSLPILHLSDLHYSDVVPLRTIEQAIQLGLEQQPKLAFITGDFKSAALPDYQAYVKCLRLLSSAVPTYACLGNHDYETWRGPSKDVRTPQAPLIIPLLQGAGITLLRNESRLIQHQGQSFNLIGLGDLWTSDCLPAQAFASIDPNLPSLLLSHNPDSKSLLSHLPWQLMLCGHTHGGQVKVPLFGALHAPITDFRYIEGLNPYQQRWIYTTRGVGNLHGIRFNCRPEVSLLHLNPAS
ncbi:MAG: phosphodiesterase YaeI [Blastochloris sp.]|nr:phosphodiesterase YaeI [Blastochloris sp.]